MSDQCKCNCSIKPEPWEWGNAIDLEIYESPSVALKMPDKAEWVPIKPNIVVINGVKCLTADEPIKIDGLTDREHCLTATIKLMVRTLKVHGGDGIE